MFARTPRLTLRHGWPEDASALTQAISHASVVTKLSRAPWPYTLADATAFLSAERTARDATMLIFDHAGGDTRLVGGIGVHPEGDAYELGYWLTPAAWGHGYATEAARQVLEIARHAFGLRRIAAGHFVGNAASARVLAKLGFRPTGVVAPLHCRALGRDVDSVKLALDLA